MADDEVIHIAVAPSANPDASLAKNVAAIINRGPYNTRLLLVGKVPKFIAHYDSMQIAESVTQNACHARL